MFHTISLLPYFLIALFPSFQAMLHASGFDQKHAHDVQRLMWRVHSGSHSTQAVLESTFAHLRDVTQRHAKKSTISPYSSWLYASASPFLSESGMDEVLPSSSDFLRYFGQKRNADSRQMVAYNHAFKPDSSKFPEAQHVALPKTAAGLAKATWRSAGPLSHYKASACMAYLVADAANHFENASKCWCGVVLYRHGIFLNDGVYWLSLGFQHPCVLCISLTVIKDQGQDILGF